MTKKLMANDLFFSYPSRQWSIGAINIAFDKGINLLVGPNAEGKSTLLKLFSGLLTPTNGNIFLNGVKLQQFDKKDLAKHIGWLPQSAPLPLGLRAAELLSLGRIPHLKNFWGTLLDEKKINDIIEKLEIPCKPNDRIETLSGGTRQLLQIGRLFVQEPSVYLLDEPFEGVDQKHQRLTLEYLKIEAEEKEKLVLISTHHLSQPIRFAEKIFLVQRGNLRKIEKELKSESEASYQLDF